MNVKKVNSFDYELQVLVTFNNFSAEAETQKSEKLVVVTPCRKNMRYFDRKRHLLFKVYLRLKL